MAGFGGAVKLTGESEYRKALKAISQDLKELSAETKLVSAQYASNSKSIEALTAKQAALAKQYDAQAQKVKILKDQYAAMSAEQAKNKEKHEQLLTAFNEEGEKLNKIAQECGRTSDEYKAQLSVVGDLGTQLDKSSKTMDQNETAMSKMRTELTNATTEMTKTENELNSLDTELKDAADGSQEFGKEVKDAGDKAEKAGNGGFTVLKGVLADLGASAIKAAVSGLKQIGGAILDTGKQAIAAYADYEQLVGGVETLFGDAAQTVIKNASQAYKTAGMSANEYMENVTSFSASLVSAVGGDTQKAAEAADLALQDMSDNANKMGTSLDSITQAYQGFAKGQYTLLDNLKLGYGGTKGEMERLLKDAEKFSGVKYDINNLNDVYSAIHVIQSELGITGATSKEAATTISGSTQMMSSAWQNLLTGVADDTADFDGLINDFIESVLAVADNLLPRIQTAIQGMAKLASGLLQKLLPELVNMIPPLLQQGLPVLLSAVNSTISSVLSVLPSVISTISGLIPEICSSLISQLPMILSSGIDIINSLISGISEAIPSLLKMLPSLISEVVNTLLDHFDEILDTGIELVMSLIDGLIEATPLLLEQLPILIGKVVSTLIINLPKILEMGVRLISSLISGLIKATPQLIKMFPELIKTIGSELIRNFPLIVENGKSLLKSLIDGAKSIFSSLGVMAKDIISNITNGLKDLPSKMLDIGKNIVQGMINGVKNMASKAVSAVKDLGKNLLNGVKNALGIHSPSSLFRDQVGKNIALGIGEGFTEEMRDVSQDMQDAIPTLDVGDADYNVSGLGTGALNYQAMVNAFKQALSEVDVVLDDRQVGRFVKKTVENAIYT